jgi:hypothetical protein
MCEVALHIDHQRRRQDRMSGTNFQQHFSAYRYMQPWLTQLPVTATALRVRAGSEGGRKSLAKQTGGQGQTQAQQQSRKSSQGSVHVGGAASQLSDELEADIPVRGRRSSAGKMKVDTQVSCCCCCCYFLFVFVCVCVYSLFLCLRLYSLPVPTYVSGSISIYLYTLIHLTKE